MSEDTVVPIESVEAENEGQAEKEIQAENENRTVNDSRTVSESRGVNESRTGNESQIAEIFKAQLEEVKRSLLLEFTSQLDSLKAEILKEVKQEIQTAKEEITASVSANFKNEFGSIMTVINAIAAVDEEPPQEEPTASEIVEVELHPIAAIQAKTQEDQTLQMAAQLKAIKLMGEEPANGSTMQGNSIADICAGIPSSAKASVTVQLTNFLETSLTNPLSYFGEGFEFRVAPKVIASSTKEAFVFQSARGVLFAGDRVYGLFSYDIGTTNKRLLVKFGCRDDGLIMSGVAIAGKEVPVNLQTYEYLENAVMEGKSIRTDLKNMREWKTEGHEWIVTHQNTYVRVLLAPGPKAVMEVEIAQNTESRLTSDNLDSKKLRPVAHGRTMLEKFLPGMAAFINDKRVCIVELVNLLDVPLEDSFRYIHNCKQHDFMPAVVPAFTREAFFTSDDANVEGIISYRIATTDLRLAVMFRSQQEGNSLALAFTSIETATDKKLMDYLTTADAWKTRTDRKFANAKDGDQFIEMRNLRAVVTMTDKEKAVMRVVVYAL